MSLKNELFFFFFFFVDLPSVSSMSFFFPVSIFVEVETSRAMAENLKTCIVSSKSEEEGEALTIITAFERPTKWSCRSLVSLESRKGMIWKRTCELMSLLLLLLLWRRERRGGEKNKLWDWNWDAFDSIARLRYIVQASSARCWCFQLRGVPFQWSWFGCFVRNRPNRRWKTWKYGLKKDLSRMLHSHRYLSELPSVWGWWLCVCGEERKKEKWAKTTTKTKKTR